LRESAGWGRIAAEAVIRGLARAESMPEFYAALGFKLRPPERPGMQMRR